MVVDVMFKNDARKVVCEIKPARAALIQFTSKTPLSASASRIH